MGLGKNAKGLDWTVNVLIITDCSKLLSRKAEFSALSLCPYFQGWTCSSIQPCVELSSLGTDVRQREQ